MKNLRLVKIADSLARECVSMYGTVHLCDADICKSLQLSMQLVTMLALLSDDDNAGCARVCDV